MDLAGTVGFESAAGLGATFWLDIPIHLGTEKKSPAKGPSAIMI